MQKKIVSIITPSLNQEQFIEKTILSVLTQSGDFYLDYVINDGNSHDSSCKIIQKYEQLLKEECDVKNINGLSFFTPKDREKSLINCLGISYRWLSEKDSGQSNAISKGLKIAVGEIVAWLNSDDYYLDFALDKIHSIFINNVSTDVVYGEAVAIDAKNNVLWSYDLPKMTIYSLLYKKQMVPQPSIFFKKELIDRLGLLREDLHYCMDSELLARFLTNDAILAAERSKLSVQTYHEGSKSCSQKDKFLTDRAKTIEHYKNRLSDRHLKEVYKAMSKEFRSKKIFSPLANLFKKVERLQYLVFGASIAQITHTILG